MFGEVSPWTTVELIAKKAAQKGKKKTTRRKKGFICSFGRSFRVFRMTNTSSMARAEARNNNYVSTVERHAFAYPRYSFEMSDKEACDRFIFVGFW